jgi:two-component system NtrC family sensor kinase
MEYTTMNLDGFPIVNVVMGLLLVFAVCGAQWPYVPSGNTSLIALLLGMGFLYSWSFLFKRIHEQLEMGELPVAAREDISSANVQLQESRETLRKLYAAVEQSPVIVMITDMKGTIEFVNPHFTHVTGFSAEEVIGQNPRILKGDTLPETHRLLWELLCAGKVWKGDFHNRKKDGSYYLEHATVSPIRNEAGDVSHFIAVKVDITEQRRLEEQLRQSQKMEVIGQLAGGVAHDFNNIMQVIMGNAQLQAMQNYNHNMDCKYPEAIFKAVERGASLTRSLLVFSRKQPLELSCFNLANLVDESSLLVQRLVTEDIVIRREHDGNMLTIKGDAGLVQHVVFNLVTNARDAISRQGHITISTARVEIDGNYSASHGAVTAAGCYALLTVRDTGSGIDTGIRSKIFEPFFTTKEMGKGTGLGLAMTLSTVQLMNGFIVVNSQPGAGTAIEVYVPLSDENTAHPVYSCEDRSGSGNGELILIVEDEIDVRESFSMILTRHGYQVVIAGTGNEAIALARENSSALKLAIIDMVMPGMDGMETARELRFITPELPVVFLSGHSLEALAARGIAETHLHKPVYPVQLLDHIGKLLDASRSEQGTG